MLDVSRGGFYAWRDRRPGPRERFNGELVGLIGQSLDESDYTYGVRRITEDLHEWGYPVNHKRVERLKRRNGLYPKQVSSFALTTDSGHDRPVSDNLLDREFEPERINEVWASDITYIPSVSGWLYLAVVLDLYSRKVIGWALARHLRADLVETALRLARARRGCWPKLFHSDQGSQYASEQIVELLAGNANTVQLSMSRRGNCWDNAVVESFFGTLKTEHVNDQCYQSLLHAQRRLFRYIEQFYNRKRRHSFLSNKSPEAFESAA
jgi:transposase InsO family protein